MPENSPETARSEFVIMGEPYSLCSIGLEDVEEMEALDNLCFSPDLAFTEGYFRLLFHYDKAFGWSLKQEDIIAGFILLTPKRQNATIATIDVHPDFRRRGLGKKLLDHAEEMLIQMDAASISLQVHTENAPAISLYETSGYSIVKRIPDYYPIGDAFLMRKKLK